MCESILHLIIHVKNNRKDITAFIRLRKELQKRRKLLLYLKRNNYPGYREILAYFCLKDIQEPMYMYKTPPKT